VAPSEAGGYPSPVNPRFILVDGSGYIFRAYFALRQTRQGGRNIELTTSYGMPTGALHVFSNMLMRLYLDERPDFCAVVFDSEGRTFRHELYSEYKATRKERPPDLTPQLPWFEPIVRGFQLPVVKLPGVEADDVIATLTRLARARGMDVTIFGADKDLMSLVDDEGHVTIVDTMREIVYDAARVVEKFGVGPSKVSDWLALRGDSSDNIPGVAGIGEVTATRLLASYGSIEGILTHAHELKGKLGDTLRDPVQLQNLELSRRLVALRADIEVPDILSFRRHEWNAAALAEIFTKLEFNRFVARLAATFVSDPDGYVTVGDEAALDALVAAARAAGEMAFDIQGELTGLSIATKGHPAAYLPLGHRYLGVPRQLDPALVLERLRPLLEDPAIVKYGQDYKHELGLLERRGIALVGVRCDPMLGAYLLDPGAVTYDVPALARRYLDHKTVVLPKKSFEEIELPLATRFAAEEADIVLALGKLLRGRVEAAGMASLMDDVEMPLARVLGVMERNGIRVEVPVLKELGQKLGEECQRLERQIQEIAGFPVNPGSPKQLVELLYEKLGLRGANMRRTKSGAFSTDADQLEELIDAHPIVKPILEHRELIKLKGTYLDALPAWVSPEDKRLHTRYIQVAASTGRLASKDPNVQNIPIRTALGKEVRRAFVADDGFLLVSADYSQIELRIVAHLSRDPVLVAAFAGDVDVHAQTAAEVFAVGLAEVTPEMRRVAKAVNYGLGYGQSDFGLSRALDIPRDKARVYIESYFHKFARVREFMEQSIAEARRTQVARTLLGRRIPIPGISSQKWGERAAGERFARNAPIQGSAADILKLAMLKMHAHTGPEARMILTVHDELVFEVAEARAQEFAALAKREMEAAFTLEVPLRIDVGVARSWADAH
jgi:DNA polymerase I